MIRVFFESLFSSRLPLFSTGSEGPGRKHYGFVKVRGHDLSVVGHRFQILIEGNLQILAREGSKEGSDSTLNDHDKKKN